MIELSRLLTILEQSKLVSPQHIERLRKLHSNSPQQFTARVAVKWLMSHGEIGAKQAERLLAGDLRPADEEELRLAPIEDDPVPAKTLAGPVPIAPVEPPVATPLLPDTKDTLDALYNDPSLLRDAAVPAGRPLSAGPLRVKSAPLSWDSPLLLGGGAALLVLIFALAALWWSLQRESADTALRLAEEDFQAGSYDQAIHKFDRYLENHPDHPGVSRARVERGLAQLRQVVELSGNWPQSLATAQRVLEEIAQEPNFADAHADLSAMLPKIAEALARQAADKPEAERIAQGREALALAQNGHFVPSKIQPIAQLVEIEQLLNLADRRLGRDQALAEAESAIRGMSGGDPMAAHDRRRALLEIYPELRDTPSLSQAMASVASQLAAAVETQSLNKAASTDELPTPVVAGMILARRTGQGISITSDPTIAVLAGSAAYGLAGSNGEVRWRRYLGGDGLAAPAPVSPDPAADLLLVDAVRQQLLRVASKDGSLQWRCELGEPAVGEPLVLRRRAGIASRAGAVTSIDLESGKTTWRAKLPQSVNVGPVADQRGRVIYQLAEHSNLYMLDADEGRCLGVFYVGHEPLSIAVPPILVGRYVLLAENVGLDRGMLHVLATDDAGVSLRQVQRFDYEGQVLSPLLVAGRTATLATDRGAIMLFEANTTTPDAPLTKITEKPAEKGDPVIRFLSESGGRLFVAGLGLTSYDAQTSRARLAPSWVEASSNVAQAAAESIGPEAVVFTHVQPDTPGVIVTAIHPREGRTLWETTLAVPAVDLRSLDDATITALDANGDLFVAKVAGATGFQSLNSPELSVEIAQALRAADVATIDKQLVATARASEDDSRGLLVIDPAAKKSRWLTFEGDVAAPPGKLADQWLVPLAQGSVLNVDSSGKPRSEPFQPRLTPGETYPWSSPVSIENREALVADGRGQLYRLGIVDTPAPHLVSRATASLRDPSASTIAVLGKTAYLVDTTRVLQAFELPNLTPGESWDLQATPTWGPVRVGDRVLVATDEELFCLDDSGALRYRAPLADRATVAAPAVVKDAWFVATAAGVVSQIDPQSGESTVRVELGEPLVRGPILLGGDRLAVVTPDGTILLVDVSDGGR